VSDAHGDRCVMILVAGGVCGVFGSDFEDLRRRWYGMCFVD